MSRGQQLYEGEKVPDDNRPSKNRISNWVVFVFFFLNWDLYLYSDSWVTEASRATKSGRRTKKRTGKLSGEQTNRRYKDIEVCFCSIMLASSVGFWNACAFLPTQVRVLYPLKSFLTHRWLLSAFFWATDAAQDAASRGPTEQCARKRSQPSRTYR